MLYLCQLLLNFQGAIGTYSSAKFELTNMSRDYPLIKHCASSYNETLKEYFEERHRREFRRNTVGSRQKLANIQKYRCPLCKQSITDFTEKLVTQLKIPESAGGKYTYKNIELVHYKCGQYWKMCGQRSLP